MIKTMKICMKKRFSNYKMILYYKYKIVNNLIKSYNKKFQKNKNLLIHANNQNQKEICLFMTLNVWN